MNLSAVRDESVALASFVRAVRPPFLLLTLAVCLVGLATSAAQGVPLHGGYAAATLFLALLAHAAANVWNDCGDAVIGTDAINVRRITPFTGGSRVIQNGEISAPEMRRFALALAGVSIGGGLLLAGLRGPGLLGVGLAGACLGWAYSQPRLALMSRGLGELAVGASWALVVVGADFVQRGQFAALPLTASVGVALLVAALLSLNQIPDIDADRACGKRTLAVRLGEVASSRMHAAFSLGAYGWLAFAIATSRLPATAACAGLALPLGAAAIRGAYRHVGPRGGDLGPALRANVLHVLTHTALLAIGLLLAAP
ncbi:MAG TPA: prenyltransferase [Gammaproteobacteria bacterium]|nr:prenyltransferase [Gammaproteobacteria bacterium]